MTGGTQAGAATATEPIDTVQSRWNRYYYARDLADGAKTFHEIMTPPRGAPQICSDMPMSRLPSEMLLLPLGDATRVDRSVIHNPIHRPVDNRTRAEQRANKKRYRKAKAYFNKTFIVTRAEMMWASVLWVGSVLLNSALLFMVFNHLVDR